MSFELGCTYSGYQILEVVKSTRNTIVYRVRNTVAGRDELLYVLPQAAQEDPRRHERFMREMGLRARLSHPNIPAFLNATDLDGNLVMTTEMVEGRPLAEVLESGPAPPRQAAALARQVLSALSCAHELNIVHRDVSPQNISIADGGTVKLSNFGLARGVNSPQLTQAGAILGDPTYMSPEQARGTGELDSRSDIYSLGAVLYHMLCGRPPFKAASEFDVLVAHVKEAPKPPSFFNPTVPESFDAVVMKALAKDPAQRFSDCAQFAEALECAAAAPERIPGGQAARRTRAPWTLLGGAAAGLAVVVLAIWYIAHA